MLARPHRQRHGLTVGQHRRRVGHQRDEHREAADRVADDRKKVFPGGFLFGDWQEDTQLQAAIRAIAKETKLDLASLPAYREFAADEPADAQQAPR